MEDPFNKAKLFNVGVIEGIFNHEISSSVKNERRKGICYCLILHDVDMIPVSTLEEFLHQKFSDHILKKYVYLARMLLK